MTHFMVRVVLPQDTAMDQLSVVRSEIAKLLEKYNEEREVEPYRDECYCVGREAQNAARESVNKSYKSIDVLREKFQELDTVKEVEKRAKEGSWRPIRTPEDHDLMDRLWQEHIAEYIQLLEDTERAHPLYRKPRQNCSECEGRGWVTSTSNPDSQWDWYSIPYISPNHRWPNEVPVWAHPISTDDLLAKYRSKDHDYLMWALVTPDGIWHQRGKMGWWAMSCGDHSRADWMDACITILERWPNHPTVMVDCHI